MEVWDRACLSVWDLWATRTRMFSFLKKQYLFRDSYANPRLRLVSQEFSQPLECLYQAMQTRKTFSIALGVDHLIFDGGVAGFLDC